MNSSHYLEVEPMAEKAPPGSPSNGGLAVTSLVFGVLGLSALPAIGSLIAIVTGHAALGQIRESGGRVGGRSMARAGTTLGYLGVALGMVAAGFVVLLVGMTPTSVTQVRAATPAPEFVGSEPGVKMVNEMDRADFRLIEQGAVKPPGAIIACYNAGRDASDPEFALLTTSAIAYLKAGRATSFDLKDVEEILDDPEYQKTYNVIKTASGATISNENRRIYFLEIRSKQGPRMRIQIPENGGVRPSMAPSGRPGRPRAASPGHLDEGRTRPPVIGPRRRPAPEARRAWPRRGPSGP